MRFVYLLMSSFLLCITISAAEEDGIAVFDEVPGQESVEGKLAGANDVEEGEEEGDDEDEEFEEAEEEEYNQILKEVHRWLSKDHPEVDKTLLHLLKLDEEAYYEVVEGLVWRAVEHHEMSEAAAEDDLSDEELEELKNLEAEMGLSLKETYFRAELQVLSHYYHSAEKEKKEQIKASIQKTVPQLYEVLLLRRQREAGQLQKELERVHGELKEIQENKEQLIHKKIIDLTGKELLDW